LASGMKRNCYKHREEVRSVIEFRGSCDKNRADGSRRRSARLVELTATAGLKENREGLSMTETLYDMGLVGMLKRYWKMVQYLPKEVLAPT